VRLREARPDPPRRAARRARCAHQRHVRAELARAAARARPADHPRHAPTSRTPPRSPNRSRDRDGQLRQFATQNELRRPTRRSFVASLQPPNCCAAPPVDSTTTRPGQLETGELVYSTDWAKATAASSSTLGILSRSPPPTRLRLNLIQGEIRSVVNVGKPRRVRIGPSTAEVTAASADKLELSAAAPHGQPSKQPEHDSYPLASPPSRTSPRSR